MTTKDKAVAALRELPDDASYEDAIERLILLAKIERGLAQSEACQTLSHDDVKRRLGKWLK